MKRLFCGKNNFADPFGKISEKKAFSLVELIVVIAIIIILVAMLVPNLMGLIIRSKKASDCNTARIIAQKVDYAIASNPKTYANLKKCASTGSSVNTSAGLGKALGSDANGRKIAVVAYTAVFQKNADGTIQENPRNDFTNIMSKVDNRGKYHEDLVITFRRAQTEAWQVEWQKALREVLGTEDYIVNYQYPIPTTDKVCNRFFICSEAYNVRPSVWVGYGSTPVFQLYPEIDPEYLKD